MNIVHIIRDLSPATGGPVSAVLGMAGGQAAMGHNVSIVGTGERITSLPNLGEVKVHLFPCQFPAWRLSRGFGSALPGLIRNADIVHIHMIWEYPTWLSATLCKKMGKPYIIRPCGMLDKWSLSQNAWKKKAYMHLLGIPLLQNAAAVHFTTERECLNSGLFGTKVKKIVVPIGLPSTSYDNLPGRDAFLKRYPVLNGRKIILFLGRLHYKKQPEVAICAFKRVCGDEHKFHLVVAGQGDEQYVASLHQLVTDLNIEEDVTFTGILTGEAVREAFCAADMFVLPSLQENFGIAVAEAMAAGCPVVVSDRVDISPEILRAAAGLVCPPEVEETASAIGRLMEDDCLRMRMGENGRRLILEKFTWDRVTEELLAVYNDVLKDKGRLQCGEGVSLSR